MCGIIGYTGTHPALPVLLEGLKRLEYRGYDSAGVAVLQEGTIAVEKKKGRLENLRQATKDRRFTGCTGIGHTRWATHGEPSDRNSHPHTSADGSIALVHNGIIENHARLRAFLERQGYVFQSQTDTEVLVHLIAHHFKGDLVSAVRDALYLAEGSYAICVVEQSHPDTIVCARKDSPLIIGLGEGENFVASDIPAILKYTRRCYLLDDYEMALITPQQVTVLDRNAKPVSKAVFDVNWDENAAERGGYAHFMLKEIHEEDKAISETLAPRLKEHEITLENIDLSGIAHHARRVFIVACGTAYHAGMIAKYTWESVLKIPVEVDYASEFRYRSPLIGSDDLLIVISQSGETADTLAALRLGKKCGAQVLAITNVVGSSISREADSVLYTWAGPEIAVASTKAYCTQVLCLALLMLRIGYEKGVFDAATYAQHLDELKRLPQLVQEVLKNESRIKDLAHRHCSLSDAYFIGRNIDYAMALEGSLKLKEISYIHSEAITAGELKHGPIALLEQGSLLIVPATQPALFDKVASNMIESKARGAHLLAITTAEAHSILDCANDVVLVPPLSPWCMPIIAIIPMQLFAYYCAVERGYDVDKPRNLAKSVTVE